jgi:hypothetical protein
MIGYVALTISYEAQKPSKCEWNVACHSKRLTNTAGEREQRTGLNIITN